MRGTAGASGTDSTGRPEEVRWPGRRRARRRARTAAAFGILTLAVLGYAAFELASQLGGPAPAVPQASSSAVPVTLRPAVTVTATAGPSAPASPAGQPTRPPVPLTVVRAVAFGPHGLTDGDNPQVAARVLTDPAIGWLSQWYVTPSFGGLKQGTGLLLDLGRSYSVSTVKVTLGSLPGAVFQLRLGQQAAPGAFPVAATGAAATAREVLTLSPRAPVRARYVLLWFTRLPPDGAGHYQAWVRQVTVHGQPLR